MKSKRKRPLWLRLGFRSYAEYFGEVRAKAKKEQFEHQIAELQNELDARIPLKREKQRLSKLAEDRQKYHALRLRHLWFPGKMR